MKSILLYHTDNDGFGAKVAFAMYHPRGLSFDYEEYEYGQDLPDLSGYEHVLFCDVTPPVESLRELVENGTQVTVLDHHKSFKDKLIANKILFHHPYFDFYYDENLSGCAIAYYYAKAQGIDNTYDAIREEWKLPLLFQYVQDRDLWTWAIEDSREVNAGLDSLPKAVSTWAAYLHDVSYLYTTGEAVVQHIDATVKLIARQTYDFQGVGLCNCTSHWSEVGNYIVKDLGFETAFLYFNRSDGSRKWSIRGQNARAYAEIAGGGGHENAAGFLEDEDIEGWAENTLDWILSEYAHRSLDT